MNIEDAREKLKEMGYGKAYISNLLKTYGPPRRTTESSAPSRPHSVEDFPPLQPSSLSKPMSVDTGARSSTDPAPSSLAAERQAFKLDSSDDGDGDTDDNDDDSDMDDSDGDDDDEVPN